MLSVVLAAIITTLTRRLCFRACSEAEGALPPCATAISVLFAKLRLQKLLHLCRLQAGRPSEADMSTSEQSDPFDVDFPSHLRLMRPPIPIDIESYVYGGTFTSQLTVDVKPFTLSGGKTFILSASDHVTTTVHPPSPTVTPSSGILRHTSVNQKPFRLTAVETGLTNVPFHDQSSSSPPFMTSYPSPYPAALGYGFPFATYADYSWHGQYPDFRGSPFSHHPPFQYPFSPSLHYPAPLHQAPLASYVGSGSPSSTPVTGEGEDYVCHPTLEESSLAVC